MYNGIGLTTPRGSGTNGHVQRNWAFVRPNKKDNTNYRSEEDIKKLDATLNRPPNKEILDHDRKRKIEVKCIEFEEILEKQGRTPEEIKTQVDLYRQKLMGQGKTDLPKDEFGRVAVRETHQVAEAQQEKNAKLREAFNISEYFIEGSSFDSDRKAKEDLAKSVALQKELDTQREAAAAIAAAVSKEKDIAKRYTLIRTPSKERENDGDGVDAAVTNSSDREHGIKSDRKKKKKRTRESSANNERKKDKKKKSKKHKKENKSKKKKSRKRKHSSSDSTDTDDHDSEAEEPAACSSESEREVTRKQRKKAKKEKRKRDKKKRKDRGHSTDSSRPHSPDKKSTDYKKNRRNVESSKVDASSLLDAKNSTRRSRSLERKLVAVESVHQYISSTKSRCAESSSDSRRSKDRKKVNNSKKDEKEYTPDRRGVSREHRHSERTLAERKENKDKVGYSSRQERSPSRDRHRRRNSSNERHSERSKSNRRERYRGQDKRRSRTPSERDARRGSNEIRAKRRYDGREESRQKRQRRTRSGSESTCRVRSEHHNQHKVRRDSRSHSKIAKENTNQKRLVSPPQMELSSKKREPSQVKRVPFNPFKAAEDTINDILGTNNPFKNDKAAERKSSSSSSSSNTVDSEDVSSKEKSGQKQISIHSEADKKTMHKESARPTLRNSDNNAEKSRRSRSKSIRLKPSEINKRDKSRTPPHTPEPLKRVRETTPKSFHQPISTHSSRNSSELSYSPARRNPERYRDIMTISEKQDKNNSKRDNRSTTNDNIRSRHGNEKDAVSKLAPIVRLCTQSDDESDNEKLASLDEYQQTKREREQQELRMLEQLKSGIAAKAKQKIEMMATNGAGQTSGDPLVAALADSSLVDAIVSKVSTATVAAAESAARRSHSRTRRSQSRSRRANSRHHQRSSSRSRSRSRYSSSTSRSRSQRSSRSRTHSQSSHSSCSSRSSSGSSSSASSGSSRTGSRSPSIPRRRGSPSFLDRRRITSRRSSRDRRR